MTLSDKNEPVRFYQANANSFLFDEIYQYDVPITLR